LKVPGYGYYLLDCGENTLGQLKRVFEPEELREDFDGTEEPVPSAMISASAPGHSLRCACNFLWKSE
jgi:hypothetical protein